MGPSDDRPLEVIAWLEGITIRFLLVLEQPANANQTE
jgi:hypothetical protein